MEVSVSLSQRSSNDLQTLLFFLILNVNNTHYVETVSNVQRKNLQRTLAHSANTCFTYVEEEEG